MIRSEYQILLIAWALVAAWIAFVILTNRKVHPKALFFLFMVELWERFSYYGMRAFLVFYVTKSLITGAFGLEKSAGYAIYAAYGALVYLTPSVGGWLADRYMGFRRAIIWGAILMALGQFTLSNSSGKSFISYSDYKTRVAEGATEAEILAGQTVEKGSDLLLYSGLALLVIGNGFFKPNISSLIGKFYTAGDPRRDGAFTIFYMGINMGAFLAPLTCGTVAELEGWKYGFMLAGAGMVLGLCIFLYTISTGILDVHADPPKDSQGNPIGFSKLIPIYIGTFAVVPIAAFLIKPNEWFDSKLKGTKFEGVELMDLLLAIVGILAISYMLMLSLRYTIEERQRIWVIIVLLFFTTVFWTFFELAGSALNVFTDENVDKTIRVFRYEFKLTASNFQAANAFFIMLFAPIFSYLWIQLAKNNLDPPAPVKFGIGILLLGAGFLVLNLGKGFAAEGIVPALWLILLYLLHTLGELALSPVGLSLVTKLAPAQIVGFVMGFWFLSSAIAHQGGKWIAKYTITEVGASKVETLNKSLEVFNLVGFIAVGSGVLLLLFSPILKKWMHGVK